MGEKRKNHCTSLKLRSKIQAKNIAVEREGMARISHRSIVKFHVPPTYVQKRKNIYHKINVKKKIYPCSFDDVDSVISRIVNINHEKKYHAYLYTYIIWFENQSLDSYDLYYPVKKHMLIVSYLHFLLNYEVISSSSIKFLMKF